MTDQKEIHNPDDLRQQGKFAEAIPLYEESTRKDPNAYNFRWLIHCHRKNKNPEKALELCNYALRKFPNDQYLKSEMAWIIYDLEFKPAVDNKNLRVMEATAEKAFNVDPENKLLRKVISQAIIKFCKDANNPNWPVIAKYAFNINPEDLSPEKRIAEHGKRIMSEKEEWYTTASRALLETKQFAKVHDIANEGLKHFKNQFYLIRNTGLAYSQSGNFEEAEKVYDQLLLHPQKQWYVDSEIANIKAQLGKKDLATQHYAKALLKGNNEQYMIKMIENFGSVLIDQGKLDEASLNLTYARKIRESLGYKIPQSLIKLENRINREAQKDGITLTDPPESLKAIKKACLENWNKYATAGLVYQRGRVGDIFPNRKYTFITPEEGGEGIFVLVRDLPEDCQQWGAVVEFVAEKSFDYKKKRESFRATKVRRVENKI